MTAALEQDALATRRERIRRRELLLTRERWSGAPLEFVFEVTTATPAEQTWLRDQTASHPSPQAGPPRVAAHPELPVAGRPAPQAGPLRVVAQPGERVVAQPGGPVASRSTEQVGALQVVQAAGRPGERVGAQPTPQVVSLPVAQAAGRSAEQIREQGRRANAAASTAFLAGEWDKARDLIDEARAHGALYEREWVRLHEFITRSATSSPTAPPQA